MLHSTYKCVLIKEQDATSQLILGAVNFYPREVVDDSRHESEDLFCIYSGCNNNLASKCKYHFVIPADYESGKQLDYLFDKNNYFFKDWTHLLHGLLHNNGIGHLICINGINEGSAFIMHL